MSMGPEFDPLAKLKSELVRRAQSLLQTRGVATVPSRGTSKPGRQAYAGRIFVFCGGLADELSVRYRMLEEPGQPYKLVLQRRMCDGTITATFADILELAVKELRQQQVLDDLANA